jgi:hypothetical protein
MQNFYSPSGGRPFAMAAQQPTYQPFVLEGPRYAPRNRSQQAIRIALHERLAKKPIAVTHAATSMWQRMAALQRQIPMSPLPFDQEDLRWGEWAGDGLLVIDKLGQECIQSANRMIFFKHTAKGWESTKMGQDLIRVVQPLSLFATSDRSDLCFSRKAEMMLDAFTKVGLPDVSIDDPQTWLFGGVCASAYVANLFNEMGELVRLHGSSARGSRAMQRQDDEHAAKRQEVKGYFAKIARRHPTCDIKRFELKFSPSNLDDRDAVFRHMHKASGIFVRSVKLTYGDAIVGDARLIDRATGSGYLAHVVLVFSGPTAEELACVNEALADTWRNQTRGGDLVDVNAMPTFQYRATGHLHRDYETAAGQLEKAAIYLASTSEIVEVRATGGPAGLVVGETSYETRAQASRGRS